MAAVAFPHWSVGGPTEDDLAHIPGESGLPVVGNTLKLLRDPIGYTQKMVDTYGHVFRAPVLGDWNVSLIGPDANELLLRNRNQTFSSKQGWGPTLDNLFPNGLMLMDFEEHRIERRALAVAFAPGPTASYTEALNRGIAREVPAWAGTLKFYPAIKQLALVLAAESFVGLPWNEEAAAINEAFVGVVQASVAPIRKPLPFTKMKAGVDGRAFLVDYFTNACNQRRNEATVGEDIFSQFATATREDGTLLSTEEVVDQMIFLMMAAHDTLTSSSTSVMFQLAMHPEWQARLREEIWSVTGGLDRIGQPLPLDYDDLGRLPLTEQVFKESLRLRPPLPVMPRRALKAFEFGGYHIPAGTRVGIDMHYTQNSPEYWEEPEAFRPQRFETEAEKNHTPWAWVPFGGGAHKCLGMRFADMQLKLLLTHILGRYEIRAEPGYSPRWQAFPIQRPKDGLQITFRHLA